MNARTIILASTLATMASTSTSVSVSAQNVSAQNVSAQNVSAQNASVQNVHLDGIRMGTYWYGAQVDKQDLAGKVVLVEIWGS